MKKTLVLLITIVLLIFANVVVARAQQVTSECDVTKVGSGNSSQTLPAGCQQGTTILNSIDPNLQPRSDYVYYCQTDPKWNPPTNGCFIGPGGCGPSSLAMVASTLGVPTTPLQMGQLFDKDGDRSCSADNGSDIGSIMAGNNKVLADLGLKSTGISLVTNGVIDLASMKKYSDAGWLFIGSSSTFPCFRCGDGSTVDHIVSLDGVDPAKGIVSIRDPYNCTDTDPSEVAKNILQPASSINWLYLYPVKKG